MSSFLEENKERFVEELKEWLRIPSVSAKSEHKSDMLRAADFALEQLRQAGLENLEKMETPGYPVVYGEKLIDGKLPTVLVYGHYDVQPPEPLHLWKSEPFNPVVEDGKIFARGACDDKGQVFMHFKALEGMNLNGGFPCNVKVIIEGEEEVGSEHLDHFLQTHKDKLKADVVLVSDTSLVNQETPCITMSLRGLCYMEIFVKGPNRDLHSGTYGGAIQNPINSLVQILAQLKDHDNHVLIPSFYDGIPELTQQDRSDLEKEPYDQALVKEQLGVKELFQEKGYSIYETRKARPTLDINGIYGGYTGEGAKTVIPAEAFAKVSMRLVPSQDPKDIAKKFHAYVKELAASHPQVEVEVKEHHGGKPIIIHTDSPAYRAAHRAMKETWNGKEPIPVRDGASIPIVASFKSILGLDTILMGFGLDTDAIHSPNEHFRLWNFYQGIKTIPLFYHYFAEEMSK